MITNPFAIWLPLLVLAGIAGCGVNPVQSNVLLDLSQTGSIGMTVITANSALDAETVKKEVGKNLSGWRYSMAPLADVSITHIMTIDIGAIEHGSTPTGFSFSMGNSDPRALDFQKADVLPITCKLAAKDQPAQSAELNMGFSDTAVTGAHPDIRELSDHASTVCFNLLQEIQWPLAAVNAENAAKSPGWMPEIRIETESESAVRPTPTTVPAKVVVSPDAPLTPSAAPVTQPESSLQAPQSVTKEITKAGRKVYIIHNQGSPIMFKFGHERQ